MSIHRLIFKTLQLFLALVVVSFAVLLFANYYGKITFLNPYVVQSGSMEPAIPVGSVIFSIPETNYLQGDVITFSPDGNTKKLVTHRIAYKTYPNGVREEPMYLTAGDANEEFDRWEIPSSQIVGKVVLTIPHLGYAVEFAKTPKGFILFVIIPATIVIYEELRSLMREIRKMFTTLFSKKKSNTGSAQITELAYKKSGDRALYKTLILIPFFGACVVVIAFTKSYLFDEEKSNENTIGVSTSYTPTQIQSFQAKEIDISISPTP